MLHRATVPVSIERIPYIARKNGKKDDSVSPADAGWCPSEKIERQNCEQNRDSDAERNLKLHILPVYGYREEDGSEAEDSQDVEDVRAHYVAYGYIRIAVKRTDDAYRKFGHRCSDTDNCSTDDKVGDIIFACYGYCSGDEAIGAEDNTRQRQDQYDVFHTYLISFCILSRSYSYTLEQGS